MPGESKFLKVVIIVATAVTVVILLAAVLITHFGFKNRTETDVGEYDVNTEESASVDTILNR